MGGNQDPMKNISRYTKMVKITDVRKKVNKLPTKRPLFSIGVEKDTHIKEKDIEPVNYIEKDKRSLNNEICSEYHPDAGTDRFVLTKDGETYACKFYFRKEDRFTGSSFLAMCMLNEYYDRSILPEYEDGNYFMKGVNENE